MKHGEYLISEGILRLVPHETESNGFVDSRQVLQWFEIVDGKRGPLIMTSRGGDREVTDRFIELAHSFVDAMK